MVSANSLSPVPAHIYVSAEAGVMLNLQHVQLTNLAGRVGEKIKTRIKKREKKKKTIRFLFAGLTLISSAEVKHRQEPSAKRLCESPAFQREASGILDCFVTQRCRVKGFSHTGSTFNPFYLFVKNN